MDTAPRPHPDVISHYRVVSPLGAGGMGEVYAGVDETLKRRVALKAIRAEHRLDPDAKARFLREARILSQLDHPHICRVYDYIEAGDRAWLVLELIEGETPEWGLPRGIAPPDTLRVAEPAAMHEFVAYRDIAQRLVEREGDNERWRLELVYARSSIAAVQEAAGDLEGARRELETAQSLRQELARRAPEDRERRQAVATGHNRIGVVLEKLGDIDAAMQHFTADLAIREELVARNPADRSIKRPLTVAHSYVSNLYEHRGDLDAALRHLSASQEVSAAQVAADPENADWARDLARAETRLAALEHLRGQLAEAEARSGRALAILRPIAARAATDAIRQRDLAAAELGMGQIFLGRRDARGALGQAETVERLLRPLAKPGEVDTTRIIAEARLLAGASWQALGNTAEAQRQREGAREILAATAGELTETRALATWARVLLALGRVDEARPVVERLLARGYRHPTLTRAWAAATTHG
jgi:tetratricopeptide (TPR) repeat protein